MVADSTVPAVVGSATPDLVVERPRAAPWQPRYLASARALDALAAVVGVLQGGLAVAALNGWGAWQRHVWLSAVFLLMWPLLLAALRAYDPSRVGDGPEEYRAILQASALVAGTSAISAYLLSAHLSRAFLAAFMLATTVAALTGRRVLRISLHRRRSRGECMQRVLAVGHPDAVLRTVLALTQETKHGLQVVGACLPGGGQVTELLSLGVPVAGGYDRIEKSIDVVGASCVAVVGAPELSGQELRRLAWQLEDRQVDLIVAPGIIEVAGPRIRVRPAAGLSLLHVEPPVVDGGRLLIKYVLDRLLAAGVLLLLSPVLLLIAVLIRATSHGPALFSQERVGEEGRRFRLWKFRSMVPGAESSKAELHALNEADSVVFKIRQDPRVTNVGRFLRRYSLDELPQLFNVVLGQMSLVGPRPPLPEEVEQYSSDAHRRLRVRPGMTGLWQVSGRSELTWEESLRLDLRYVDNWSLTLDLLLMWRTFRAILGGRGAY